MNTEKKIISKQRRSLLFVPGTEQKKIEKALDAGADTVLLDLEDSVLPDQKDQARLNVSELLKANKNNSLKSELVVRINSVNTSFFESDLAAIVEAGGRTIMLPKSDKEATLINLNQSLTGLENRFKIKEPISILALVENASGVARVLEIASSPRVEAICFGHVDFSLDMGLPNNNPGEGIILHARMQIALGARANNKSAIDNVCLSIKDEDAFKADVNLGISLGFEGKMCIHPTQVKIANELYTPTSEQIAYAKRVLEGWEESLKQNKGVFALDGKMIDAPVIAMQQRILNRAKIAGIL